MNDLSIKFPNSLYKTLQNLAQQDGISIDQFIASAVAEKIAALTAETYLQSLAAKANRSDYDAILANVPDVPPEAYDRLPVE
jgi:hypothetical protein